jgi:hypothetical protein
MTPDHWRTVGHGLLYVGLAGEMLLILMPEGRERALKIVSVGCALLVFFGVASENHADTLFKAPRSIGEVDAMTMEAELQEYRGTKVDVLARTEAPDADAFRDRLGSILVSAHWIVSRGDIGADSRSVFNVLIELGPKDQANASDAAQALTEELARIGVVAKYSAQARPAFTGIGGLNPDVAVSVMIGPRD